MISKALMVLTTLAFLGIVFPFAAGGEERPEGMAAVKGGTFRMGTDEQWSNEEPVHEVTIDSFYIGKFEVTQQEWTAVMGNNPSVFKGERLPTDAEWEYACRGGLKSNNYRYSGSNNPEEVAWYEMNARENTHPVGQKMPNELGIYDMSGNAWEWCWDRQDKDYYQHSPLKNPRGASQGNTRIYRGGSSGSLSVWLRSTGRYNYPPSFKYWYFGFRVARGKTGKPSNDMILVRGGTFKMGSPMGKTGEKPGHPVTLTDFYIGKYEVTQEEWMEVMNYNHSIFKGAKNPVDFITWYEAVEYCNKRSQKQGLTPCYTRKGDRVTCNFEADGYRLPTEAEWEYACRGGLRSRGYRFSGGNNPEEIGWYRNNSWRKHHPVGQKKPNELGIYDMSGNVAEWCWDRYDKAYYQQGPPKNPTGPRGGENRLYRGGHVCAPQEWLRYWTRFSSPPLYKYFNLGFRVVRNDPGKPPALKNMVLVRGGTFNMGSGKGKNSEKLVHEITLTDFYIGKYEVTQEDWRAVMGNSPSLRKGGKSPVHMVDWYETVEYCNKRSQMEGLVSCYSGKGDQVVCDFQANGYRLPTEAEWEYACRGGRESRHYRFSGSNQADRVAWYKENLTIYFQPVGLKNPNELGIYDMSGNMWEWCWDWFDVDYYKVSPPQNPKGPSTGIRRVVHGGSWSQPEEDLWCSARARLEPYQKSAFITFRVVKSVN